jgi:hypothetical protein
MALVEFSAAGSPRMSAISPLPACLPACLHRPLALASLLHHHRIVWKLEHKGHLAARNTSTLIDSLGPVGK